MNALIPANQRRVQAREAFFQSGQVPPGLIDEAILNSWHRCATNSKSASDQVAFDTVTSTRLSELLQCNRVLLEAAASPMERLSRTVTGAGYAVLLTDRLGHALTAYSSGGTSADLMHKAFRQGVLLSEDSVGTTAMSCAVSEGRPVAVSGVEHFLNANRIFNCAAAPVFDPAGRIMGAIDITREHPMVQGSALSLVQQCAKTIERQLMGMLAPYILVNLGWGLPERDASEDMLLALGEDGQILGMSPRAREVIGLEADKGLVYFSDLFDLRFEALVDSLRKPENPLSVEAFSGLSFSLKAADRNNENLYRSPIPQPVPLSRPEPEPEVDFGDASVNARAATALKALARQMPVLVLGDTGTGKEVMARTLHERSGYAAGEFVAINCAAIPESLIEGELFGHAEGAFTGARRGGSNGKIAQAHKGTLFLDEIGDMPLALQSRLLRVIESREVTRLGEQSTKRFDFQLVCATHRNLSEAVQNGEFREDLYYRVKGITVELPRLSERPDLKAFIQEQCRQVTHGRALSDNALHLMMDYPWPGNVRELRHALAHADVMADPDSLLLPEHLPSEILAQGRPDEQDRGPSMVGSWRTVEREAIEQALACENGNVQAAANRLGMSRATLYRRLKAQRSV
ncbi:sigma-54-dependent Fis family transcriptional regulator [Marinobacter salinexigens]|nr:sigma-54-dependent Fis family transcriptional regulator [Marinobacter salinexigens]